ncbi:hypothetical protein pqer_cds_13 [Pandoravirus quercus]|uniref:Uncharacterized protein n=1 Tax=Pandoravirus quercus TaxID=2107709 RepID=A0A2U7U7N9_9VIRU|nr:hypothetical protein pqer_cds_13 [Pandoravirus quercus]AVK74435.1 hypothetical protein pqer_cds_13 [Pandoravirus quercus]
MAKRDRRKNKSWQPPGAKEKRGQPGGAKKKRPTTTRTKKLKGPKGKMGAQVRGKEEKKEKNNRPCGTSDKRRRKSTLSRLFRASFQSFSVCDRASATVARTAIPPEAPTTKGDGDDD